MGAGHTIRIEAPRTLGRSVARVLFVASALLIAATELHAQTSSIWNNYSSSLSTALPLSVFPTAGSPTIDVGGLYTGSVGTTTQYTLDTGSTGAVITSTTACSEGIIPMSSCTTVSGGYTYNASGQTSPGAGQLLGYTYIKYSSSNASLTGVYVTGNITIYGNVNGTKTAMATATLPVFIYNSTSGGGGADFGVGFDAGNNATGNKMYQTLSEAQAGLYCAQHPTQPCTASPPNVAPVYGKNINALLNLTALNTGSGLNTSTPIPSSVAPGYIITRTGLYIGLTQNTLSAAGTAYPSVALTAQQQSPGSGTQGTYQYNATSNDWQTPPMLMKVTNSNPTVGPSLNGYYYGTIKVDTGINNAILLTGNNPTTTNQFPVNQALQTSTSTTPTSIAINLPGYASGSASTTPALFTYVYQGTCNVGGISAGAATTGCPSSPSYTNQSSSSIAPVYPNATGDSGASVGPPPHPTYNGQNTGFEDPTPGVYNAGQIYLNTGVNFLNYYNIVYDPVSGFISYQPVQSPSSSTNVSASQMLALQCQSTTPGSNGQAPACNGPINVPAGTSVNQPVFLFTAIGNQATFANGSLATPPVYAAIDVALSSPGSNATNPVTFNGVISSDTIPMATSTPSGPCIFNTVGQCSTGVVLNQGFFVFNALNTYQGATTVNSGATLALGPSGGIANSYSVTVNGTFDISNSSSPFVGITTLAGSGTVQLGSNGLVMTNASTEFSGAINGSGGLEIASGTQTLSGPNTYTGPTQIDQGAILTLKGAGSIASSSYVSFAPTGSGVATLDISQTTSGASVGGLFDTAGIGVVSLGGKTLAITSGSLFSGVIQDGGIAGGSGGSLVISNGASQGLSGVNTYTGSTTINAGATLSLSGTGSIATSSGVNIAGPGATFDISGSSGGQTIKDLAGVTGSTIELGGNSLTAGTANSTSFAGIIQSTGAPGSLIKQGTGTLTLSNTNTYTGATTVNGGTLSVTGDISSSSGVTINAGGTLAGFGTVPTTTVNAGGALAPSNGGAGALTVAGGLTFVSGSFFAPQNATSATVTGVATLAGTAMPVFASGAVNKTSTILSAPNFPITTKFDALVLPAQLSGNLSYTTNDVTLNLNSQMAQVPGFTGNQSAVGSVLDNAFNKFGSLPGGLGALYTLSPSQLASALSQLSGQSQASQQTVLANQGLAGRSTIMSRLRAAPYTGSSGPEAALAYAGPEAVSMDDGGDAAAPLGYASTKKPTAMSIFPIKDQVVSDRVPVIRGLTFWAQGLGGWGKVNGNATAAGTTGTFGGLLSGADVRLANNWLVGMAFGFSQSNTSAPSIMSSAGVETGLFAAYAGTSVGAFNFRMGGTYGLNEINSTRSVIFPGFTDRDTAHYNAGTGQVFGEVGYGTAVGAVAVEPFAGLAWVHLNTAGFTESGGAAALSAKASAQDTGYTTLGMRAAVGHFMANGMALVPRVSLGWQYAFGELNPASSLAFATLPGTNFSALGVPIARNSALIDAGADLRINPQAKIGLYYSGQHANSAHENAVRGTIAWNF
jgi:outer membrane autotransporter protein